MTDSQFATLPPSACSCKEIAGTAAMESGRAGECVAPVVLLFLVLFPNPTSTPRNLRALGATDEKYKRRSKTYLSQSKIQKLLYQSKRRLFFKQSRLAAPQYAAHATFAIKQRNISKPHSSAKSLVVISPQDLLQCGCQDLSLCPR